MKITVYAGNDSDSDIALRCTADVVQGLMLGYNRIPERFRHNLDWVGIQTERLDAEFVRMVKLNVKLSVETAKVYGPLLSLVIDCSDVKDDVLREKVAEKFHSKVIHRLVQIGVSLEDPATWFKNAAQKTP